MKEKLKNALGLETFDLLEDCLEMFVERRLEEVEEKFETLEKRYKAADHTLFVTLEKQKSAAEQTLESKVKELKLLDIHERFEHLGKSVSDIDSRLSDVDVAMLHCGQNIEELVEDNKRLWRKVKELGKSCESKFSMIDQTMSLVSVHEQQMQLNVDAIKAGAYLSLQMENERLKEQNIQLQKDNTQLENDKKRLTLEAYKAVVSFQKALKGGA